MANSHNSTLNVLSPEAAYDLASVSYDTWNWQAFWRTFEYPIVRRFVESSSRTRSGGASLLDLGCGTGWYLERLEDLCVDRRGIDISRGMLTIASKRLKNVLLTHSDLMEVKLIKDRYDVVLCTRVLSHIRDAKLFFEKTSDCMTNSGTLIISDIDPTHNYLATKLPALQSSIYAKTFKRDRDEIIRIAEASNLMLVNQYVIGLDGQIQEVVRGRDFNRLVDLVGWISIWKK